MPSMTRVLHCEPIKLSQEFKASLAAHVGDARLAEMTDNALREYLNPNPNDYVMIPMRALSATSVQGGTINFGHNNGQALKDAVSLFDGLTIFKNHDQNVDGWLGKTEQSYWDTSIPDTPPGVNFMLKIDTKADPKLARGLMTGMLESGSVTTQFDFDKSHPKMKDHEFFMQLGETVDGKLVQALVTKITRNYEYSVVWQGADPNAKKINPDGTINRSGLGLELNDTTEEQHMKKLALKLGLPDTATETEIETALTAKLAEESAATAAKLAAEAQVTTLTATLTTKETELTAKTAEATTLAAQVVTLNAEKAALETERTTLNAKLASFTTLLTARRAEAKRVYELAEGDKASAAMKLTIDNAELDAAEAFIATFGAAADKSMPLTCTKCSSTDVTRRQSKQSDSGANEAELVDNVEVARMKAAVSSIHAA